MWKRWPSFVFTMQFSTGVSVGMLKAKVATLGRQVITFGREVATLGRQVISLSRQLPLLIKILAKRDVLRSKDLQAIEKAQEAEIV